MTLVWLALILAFLVFALIYVNWDISTTFKKQTHAFYSNRWKVKLPAYSEEWAVFQAEVAERRLGLDSAVASPGTLDRLAALVDEVRLEVVA